MYKELMELCLEKTRMYIDLMGSNYHELPPECDDGNYFNSELPRRFELIDIINWTSSFPIGMAYIAYAVTKDNKFLKWAEGAFELYHKKVLTIRLPLQCMIWAFYISHIR